jgi:hypothetical protein
MSRHKPLKPLTATAGNARKAVSFKKPSALKHGGFSSTDVLPWESREEFDLLRRQLFEKYRPSGPLQEDCMGSVASWMWRKRRIQKKREFDLAAELDRADNAILWKHPLPLCDDQMELHKQQLAEIDQMDKPSTRVSEDYDQLFSFSCSLYREVSPVVLRLKNQGLPAEFAEHLSKTCSEENYETTSQWVAALKKEVDSVLLPMVRKRYPMREAHRCYEAAAKAISEDRLLVELATEERIERHIDQLLRRFFQLQAADDVLMHQRKVPVAMLEASIDSEKAREPRG